MGTEIERPTQEVDLATLEKVVVNGDLSRLNPAERLQWYKARCGAAGLDVRTQPFQYLSLQGKLTLYATKAATDQLIANRKLNVQILERRHDRDLGVFEVHCRVVFPDGHSVEDFAALSVQGLKGDALCNALMKCVTKAKRRTVLSACGLRMLDETEAETIPGAIQGEPSHYAKDHQNGTGYGSGAYASPADVDVYTKWLSTFVVRVNERWLDVNTGEHGEIPEGFKELTSTFQLGGHLYKFGRDTDQFFAPDEPRGTQRDKYTAVWFTRDPKGVKAEAKEYCVKLAEAAKAKLEREGDPEPTPEDESQDAPSDDMAEWIEAEESFAREDAGSRG